MTASRNPPTGEGWDGNQEAVTATSAVATTAATGPAAQGVTGRANVRTVTEGDVLPQAALAAAVMTRWRGRADLHPRSGPLLGGEGDREAAGRLGWRWPAVLLLVCALELALHNGERNPFVATSRPDAGVETWTTADGYAMLL